MSTFSGSKPTQRNTGISNGRSITGNDESTLGAPCEDPEYGAGDPERVLELPSQCGRRFLAEKSQMVEDDTSIAGLMKHQRRHQHQYNGSTSSFPSRR